MDLIIRQNCRIGITEFSPFKSWKFTLLQNPIISICIKSAIIAASIFLAADISQILKAWIFCFAFFIPLPFQQNLVKDKVCQFYLPVAPRCFQLDFLRQCWPLYMRVFRIQTSSELTCHGKFFIKKINIFIFQSDRLRYSETGSNGKKHRKIDLWFLFPAEM